MKITQKLAVLLVFCILLSSVSLSISKDGKTEFISAAKAATVVNGTVAVSPYVTSGSARPQVLSNGWIVAAAYYDNERKIVIKVSKDKGATWSELCNIGNGTVYSADALASGNLSMTSNGTNVYILSWRFSSSGSQGTICCWKFDAATQANTNIYSLKRDIEEQITIGPGCYIAADSNGVLHAAWNSRNSNYLGGFNIRYCKSTDGGATWSTPTQMTTNSESYVNWTNPTIVIRKDNSPCIYAQHANTGASWNAIAFWYWRKDTNDWNYKGMASSAYISYSSYLHTFPSATVTEDGAIHVVWQGTYAGNTSYNNIFYSKSTDGGISWTSSIRLTELSYEQARPCITTDGSKLFVYWYGNNNTGKYQIYRKVFNGSWGAVEKITNNTVADACLPSAVDNFKQFSEPLIIYQDNEAKIVKFKAEYPNKPILTIDNTATTSGAIYLPIKGTINDPDVGEVITIKYKIDSGNVNTLPGTITSYGTEMNLPDIKIDISQLSDGRHVLDIWAEDSTGEVSEVRTNSFVKYASPRLDISRISDNYVILAIKDYNPDNAQYQLICNDRYVSEEGELTDLPVWVKRIDSEIITTEVTIKGLEAKTQYNLKLKARYSNGMETVLINNMRLTTQAKLYTPGNLSAKASNDSITIYWNPVAEAHEYEIEADGRVTTTSALSYTFKGLAPKTSHIYRIRAKNTDSASEWSSLLKLSTKTQLPEIPQNIKVTALGTGIAVSWDKVNAALGYEVEFDGTIMKTYNTELTIKGLKPDTQHTYRLRPLGVSGSGLWSDIYTVRTTNGIIGDVPRNITSKVTNTTITLLWEPVGDAEGYDIAPVSPDGTPGTAIDNGKLPTCEIRGLTPNASYAYVIRAKNSGGCGPWSSVISVGTCLLGTPGNIQTAESDTSILFTWEPVPLAQGYELKINNITNAADISGASFSLTGLVPGTEYRYSLRAKGSGGNGGWSEEKSVFTVPQKPSVPANVNATVSDTKINIAWTALADTSIVGYDVELDGVVLENDTETAYIHEGLAPYSLHTYRVRARNELVEGEWSTASSIRTLPSKPQVPEGIIIKSTQTGATLTWQPELGASGYDLYIFRLDEDGTEIPVGEITDIAKTSYTHRRQIKGEEYRYRLRTRNVHGLSPWSGDIINNAIKAQCKKGNTLDLGLTATDVVDFGSYEMVVTYNPGVVEVADLSTLTGAAELTVGKIEGTGITIKEFSPGRIVFAVDKAVTPGEAWTGVINGIKFKARETGGTTITYTVFEKEYPSIIKSGE